MNRKAERKPPAWIKFVEVDLRDGRKTQVWAVMTLDGATCLGRVGWYSPWRKYCYIPAENTIYEQDCLRLIAETCEIRTQEYKARRKRMSAPELPKRFPLNVSSDDPAQRVNFEPDTPPVGETIRFVPVSAPETPRCPHGITKGVCSACLNSKTPPLCPTCGLSRNEGPNPCPDKFHVAPPIAEAQTPAQNGLVCHCDDCALARGSRVPAGETPPTTDAKQWLLQLIVKERNEGNQRFLHSFYSSGSDAQVLEYGRQGTYGHALLYDFENSVTLAEVAEWMEKFRAASPGEAPQPAKEK